MRKTAIVAALVVWALLGCGQQTQDPGKQAMALIEKGAEHFKKKEYDLALESYKKALELNPKSAVAYNMMGMAYRFKFEQSRSQELKNQEIAAFAKAIEIDPTYWVAMINLGVTYYHQGDKAKAAPLFKKAMELKPDHPEKGEMEKRIAEGEKKP
ncbi:MAG: tetratricopeptide repeat protein [Deltaproteobacteria bacterium]|nr:tetratricopeptide repeat protein [Deltaproteobacteria bacterium]